MKRSKTLIALTAAVLLIGASSVTAMAASNYSSPAEALAALTGKSVESILEERSENNKSLSAIAKEFDQLEAFQAEVLKMKKDWLEEKVLSGTITRERADEIIKALGEKQANCDGTGMAGAGRQMGAGFGKMNGNGQRLGGGFNGCGGGYGGCGII